MAKTLSGDELAAAMTALDRWVANDGGKAITRTFVFANFNAAFGFMARVALVAEKSDHHPDWSNVYKTVTVTLSTHDASGVTEKDVALAKAMNRIAVDSGL